MQSLPILVPMSISDGFLCAESMHSVCFRLVYQWWIVDISVVTVDVEPVTVYSC